MRSSQLPRRASILDWICKERYPIVFGWCKTSIDFAEILDFLLTKIKSMAGKMELEYGTISHRKCILSPAGRLPSSVVNCSNR